MVHIKTQQQLNTYRNICYTCDALEYAIEEERQVKDEMLPVHRGRQHKVDLLHVPAHNHFSRKEILFMNSNCLVNMTNEYNSSHNYNESML
jgi:hypothetical protein